MTLGKHFQRILYFLLCFGVVWIVFLIAAHLVLDFEESQLYYSRMKAAVKFAAFDELDISQDESINQPKCEIPFDLSFPDCINQVQRLRDTWQYDPCFQTYDVDGSDCSILIYLSEIEAWCPRLPWRKHMKKKEKTRPKAELQDEIDPLMRLLTNDPVYNPLAIRTLYSWRHWRNAYRFMRKELRDSTTRYVKKIFVYIGELSDKPSLMRYTTDQVLSANLMQWSDLVTSLYILGHTVTISSDRQELVNSLLPEYEKKNSCKEQNSFDLVFIDHIGIQHMTSSTKDIYYRIWTEYRCKLRVLDPFGTDAEFNFAKYNDNLLPGGRSSFGNMELNLRQFMTRFYVSGDNSFLGFAVGSHDEKRLFLKKKKRIVIFGDSSFTLENKTLSWLNFINKFMRIHYLQIQDDKENKQLQLPSYIIKHDSMKYDDFERLVAEAKAVIVMGKSTENIIPAIAVGRGCFVINQKFNPPKDRTNTDYLQDKPSLRKLSSRNPYLAKNVGKPHVITLDINNQTEMKQVIRHIVKTKVKTYIPFEITAEGFLQRLNAYIEHQDFCQTNDWPPILELQVKVGLTGESCQDVCSKQGLVCEPMYFDALNSIKIHGCRKIMKAESVIAPAKEANSTICLAQKQPFLYNCQRHSPHYRRICPCRTYKTGQRSLCEEC